MKEIQDVFVHHPVFLFLAQSFTLDFTVSEFQLFHAVHGLRESMIHPRTKLSGKLINPRGIISIWATSAILDLIEIPGGPKMTVFFSPDSASEIILKIG